MPNCIRCNVFPTFAGASIYIFSLMIHFWLIGIIFWRLRVIRFQCWVLGTKGFRGLTCRATGLLSRWLFCLCLENVAMSCYSMIVNIKFRVFMISITFCKLFSYHLFYIDNLSVSFEEIKKLNFDSAHIVWQLLLPAVSCTCVLVIWVHCLSYRM